jgi:XTP/dITP diphosphohydrolase
LIDAELLVATTNPGKVREIRKGLEDLPLAIHSLPDVLPGASFHEKGTTFLENALAKAQYYSRQWQGLVLAEDSGLEIAALGRAPGVRSARFSAPNPTNLKNNRKVLRLLRGVPPTERKARFVCVMVLAREGKAIKEIRGEVRGRIALEPRGANGFGYDPLFYYPPLRRTFAELAPADKNAVSHRGRALRRLHAYLASGAFENLLDV